MEINIIDFKSDSVTGQEKIGEQIFSGVVRADIISQVIRWQLAKRRSGCHKAKGISDISGTTRKPYKQKGTGRARQGSLRSPQFRGGAVIFGPVVREHGFKLNKKIRVLGLRAALISKMQSNKLFLLDEDDFTSTKTADLLKYYKQHQLFTFQRNLTKILVIGEECNNLQKASSNIHGINLLPVIGANVYDVIKHEFLIVMRKSLPSLMQRCYHAN